MVTFDKDYSVTFELYPSEYLQIHSPVIPFNWRMFIPSTLLKKSIEESKIHPAIIKAKGGIYAPFKFRMTPKGSHNLHKCLVQNEQIITTSWLIKDQISQKGVRYSFKLKHHFTVEGVSIDYFRRSLQTVNCVILTDTPSTIIQQLHKELLIAKI